MFKLNLDELFMIIEVSYLSVIGELRKYLYLLVAVVVNS